MPSDTSQLPYEWGEPQTVAYTELYPKDDFGMREVPVIKRDVYGRKSRVVMERMNEHQYKEWLKEQR